jgi:carbohydrate-selective porin OprB
MLNASAMSGDWGGVRTKLANRYGVNITIFNHTDFLGAASGGSDGKSGIDSCLASGTNPAYSGTCQPGSNGFGVWNRIRVIGSVDMSKLAHIKGLSVMATGTWNNGTDVGYDPRYLGALFPIAGNDTGVHQVRLDQWWVEEDLFNNKLSLQVGQFGAETYFGWQPSGLNHFMLEPLFYAPLGLSNAYDKSDIHNSTPGAIVTFRPNKHFSYKTGVMSLNLKGVIGNGVAPNVTDGVAWDNDFDFKYGQPVNAAVVKDYSGEAHLGFTYTGVSRRDFGYNVNNTDGNAGYYANIIQPVYRVKAGSNRGLDLRAMYVWGPETKGIQIWNQQIDLSAIINGPIPSRPKDSINVGFNDYIIRSFLNTPARRAANLLGANLPVSSEKDYEVNYACWVTNWLNVMPVFDVIQDLNADPQRGNGYIVGVRTFLNF